MSTQREIRTTTLADAEVMLASIPADDRDTWVRVAMAIKAEFGDEGFGTWDAWSQTAGNYEERAARDVWRSVRPDGGVTIATLMHLAREYGWQSRSSRSLSPAVSRRLPMTNSEQGRPWLARLPVPEVHANDFERMRHPEYGEPARWWRYESAQGELMHAVARFEGPQGKAIRPASFGTDGTAPAGWRWKRPHVLIPWNLPELYARPDAPVLLCEGEKAAEAAQRLLTEYVATCGHGGAHQAHKTHWGHLARRDCLIWPDDDQASVEVWAPRVARILLDLGARVRVVDPSRLWRASA